MQRYLLLGLLTLLELPALASAQRTAEEYRQSVRSQRQSEETAAAQRYAEADALFAKVKDAESFYAVAAKARAQRIWQMYERRNELARSKGTKKQIDELNQRIQRASDPRTVYVPDVSSSHLITLNEPGTTRRMAVIQVVDEDNAIMESREAVVGRRNVEFWLSGTDTSGWLDDRTVPLTGILISAGAKSYETAIGSQRTIPLMKRIALDEKRLRGDADIREWSLKNGTKHVGAAVLYESRRLTIMNRDGKKQVIAVMNLSSADREFLNEQFPRRTN